MNHHRRIVRTAIARRPQAVKRTLVSGTITSRVAPPSSSWTTSHRRPSQSKRIFSSSHHHDLGGDTASFGSIDTTDQPLQAWEQQCHALFAVLATQGVVSTDELRRTIEALQPAQYQQWSYYEKWSAALTTLLLDSNQITHEELLHELLGDANHWLASTDAHDCPPVFATGDAVRVREYQSGIEWRRPHIRTPGYVYGVHGVIERVCGRHPDPALAAFGIRATAKQQQLYRVRFRQCDLWPEQYAAATAMDDDVVEVEIYEHWLEPSNQSTGHAFSNNNLLFNHKAGDDCVHQDHDPVHGNEDDHYHHHVHEPRPLVEQRAVEREGPPRPGQHLHQALYKVLVQKGIVTVHSVREMCERMDTAGQRLDGARLVVQAWTDPDFCERLLTDAPKAARELGIATSNPNAPTVLTVVPNTATTHNLVVCTLCSCYPSGLLGIAPSWYKSSEYRARAVREPRRVLAEAFGLHVSSQATVRVHDSTADHRYLVLPERPAGTEEMSNEELRALVTRDSMIGVAVPTTQTAV